MPIDNATESAIERAAERISKAEFALLNKQAVMEMIRNEFMIDGAKVTAQRIIGMSSRMDLITAFCKDRPGEMLYLAQAYLNQTSK